MGVVRHRGTNENGVLLLTRKRVPWSARASHHPCQRAASILHYSVVPASHENPEVSWLLWRRHRSESTWSMVRPTLGYLLLRYATGKGIWRVCGRARFVRWWYQASAVLTWLRQCDAEEAHESKNGITGWRVWWEEANLFYLTNIRTTTMIGMETQNEEQSSTTEWSNHSIASILETYSRIIKVLEHHWIDFAYCSIFDKANTIAVAVLAEGFHPPGLRLLKTLSTRGGRDASDLSDDDGGD